MDKHTATPCRKCLGEIGDHDYHCKLRGTDDHKRPALKTASQHTPTPLKVFLGHDHKTEELLLVDEQSETTYLCKFLSKDEAKADYIVRAVNAHDELVAAAKFAENVLRTCNELGFIEFKDSCAEQLRAALAKAEAQS